jgi:hypothetical protein
MELTNIRYIRDTHEVILYFNNHYIAAPATWQTYNLYCEFHNIAIDQGKLITINLNDVMPNKNIEELIAL